METRRFLLFLVLSLAILVGWTNFVAPRFFPPPPAPPAAVNEDFNAEADNADEPPEVVQNKDGAPEAETAGDKPKAEEAEPAAEPQAALVEHDPRPEITIGSLDDESGYFLQATLTTEGAAVRGIRLNDERYVELDRPQPLTVVGEVDAGTPLNPEVVRTFQTSVPAIDRQLEKFGESLATVDWKVESETPSSVAFSYRAPDGSLEVVKRYELKKVADEGSVTAELRETSVAGYQLDFSLTVRNLSDKAQTVRYGLQGPVGVPLENVENARKHRDVRAGFVEKNGGVRTTMLSAADIAEQTQDGELEQWKAPLRFIGVDMQFFAALVIPQEDQLKSPYIEVAQPELVAKASREELSEISVQLTSNSLALAASGKPGSDVTHSYALYAGPKRESLLASFGADDIVDFGFAAPISKGMLWLMNRLHDVGIPYGIAIICLTVIVRGCMYPLSRKQAVGALKMKELQPRIAELRKKYGSDREKMARAQMELFSKHNYNPLAGCLPILLQFPIFIGLYNALNSAVDLRMASFLWVDNLAAPDALFRLPWKLPYLGWDFNLLPLLTVVLFIVQQKLFMPPPSPDDEQAQMQYKMMNFMMIFMGFMFYHVPAGLCVYFIASSLWSIGERKMLEYFPPKVPDPEVAAKKNGDGAPAKKGLWAKLLEHAEAAANQAQTSSHRADEPPAGKRKSKSRR